MGLIGVVLVALVLALVIAIVLGALGGAWGRAGRADPDPSIEFGDGGF